MEFPPISLPSRSNVENSSHLMPRPRSPRYFHTEEFNHGTTWLPSIPQVSHSYDMSSVTLHSVINSVSEQQPGGNETQGGHMVNNLLTLTQYKSDSGSTSILPSKLEGYTSAPSGAQQRMNGPNENTQDEQIVIVDDDQDDLGYGAHTIRDAITSLGRSVTEQLLSGAGLSRGICNDRSPSPMSIRAPIKRERSEIGKKQRCLVCETLTSGFHFGAVSCAACSAFFRRTIAERREYTCRAEGADHLKCEINSEQRCYCRACRLHKCLRVGMDPLAVQPHRDMIGQKRKLSSGSGSNGQQKEMGTPSTPLIWENAHPHPTIIHKHSTNHGDTLVDHLNINRKLAASVMNHEAPPPPPDNNHPSTPKRISATATLLTSPNAFAEQLLAFSRTPVISHKKSSSSDREFPTSGHNGHTEVAQTVVVESDPHPSPPTEVKPPIMSQMQMQQGVDPDEEFIVYEYEEDMGGDPPMERIREIERERAVALLSTYHGRAEMERDRIDEEMVDSQTTNIGGDRRGAHSFGTSENLIELMVQSYQQLLERRRLLYCPGTIRDILSGTAPATRSVGIGERMQKQRLRVEVGLVAEFLSALAPFTQLDLEDKIALFKAVSIPYSIIEKHYTTMRRGGLQQNRIVHNDNSFTDLSDDAFDKLHIDGATATAEKCDKNTLKKQEMEDPKTLKKLFIDPLRESLQEITGAMFNMKMTDVEFCALIGVILFDPTTPGISDATRSHVKMARDRVYQDWFSYYHKREVVDSSQKVGNTMLLLPAVQSTAEKSHENYHLIRVFDLFEYDKILDEMMGGP